MTYPKQIGRKLHGSKAALETSQRPFPRIWTEMTHTSVEIIPNPRLDPCTNKRVLACGNIQDQTPRGLTPTSQTKLIIHVVHAPLGKNPWFGCTLWYHVITWDHSWLLNGHMTYPNTGSEKIPTCSPLEAGQRSRRYTQGLDGNGGLEHIEMPPNPR